MDFNTSEAPACITVLGQFAAQVERTPDGVAVEDGDVCLTYRRLDQLSNGLARRLMAAGVGVESHVGLFMEGSADLVVAVLGVWKAGAAFVPLEVAQPAARLGVLCGQAELALILTRPAHRAALHGLGAALPVPVMVLGRDAPSVAQAPVQGAFGPGTLAYLIFTSGSTGTPRAVAVEHGSLAHLMAWAVREIAPGPGDRSGQVVSIGFDPLVLEILPYLLTGGTVCVAARADRQSPELLQAWLLARQVSVFFAPTSLGEALLGLHWPAPCCVRLLIVGGETLRQFPRADIPFQVMNVYGPTENTVVTTWGIVPEARGGGVPEARGGGVPEARGSLPSIGRPIEGHGVWFLDEDGRPVARGEIGELYLTGPGLARGYHGDAALTAERFLPCPAALQAGARMYRTGDFGRWRADGEIEFLGRRDRQLKVHGHRVELAEIEACLLAHPRIGDAAVLARPGADGLAQLAAYVVARYGGAADAKRLVDEARAHLAARLPDYMRPASVFVLPALPHTVNGKVDLQSLAAVTLLPHAARVGSDTERKLAAIYRLLLGVSDVGPASDFFELGGYSLLTTRLVLEIEDAFGVNVAISEVYEHPRIAALSALITARSGGAQAALPACVVPIQCGGALPPVFLAAPGGGSPLCYRMLAPDLGAGQPVFGLQVPGLLAGEKPLRSVEEIAALFVAGMRTVQKEGPYRIGGWSFGATVAWEMAAQLAAQGQAVALLALIDGGALATARRRLLPLELAHAAAMAARFMAQVEWPRTYAGWREFAQFVGIGLPESWAWMGRLGWRARLRVSLGIVRDSVRSLRVFVANTLAELRYRPRVYTLGCVLLRAGGWRPGTADPLVDGVRRLANGAADVVAVEGTHMSLILDPAHRRAVAQVVAARLEGGGLCPLDPRRAQHAFA
jgi:amino acid adenylation domain-containing protein